MRLNKISFIFGDRGTGKSYFTINKIIKPHKKKVLIVDTLDHPAYKAEGFQLIETKMLPRWKSGVKRIIINPVTLSDDIKYIAALTNCLVIFEDATKYVRTDAPKELFQFIYDSKQKNVDILFQYHGFKKVLPELLDNANFLTLFKLKENIKEYKYKIPDFDTVAAALSAVNKSSNPYINKTIQVD